MPETYTDVLIGRQDEIRRLDALLQAARQGRGGALVLRGEPGIGKSVLLRHLDEAATGFLVMRASGAEFEMELPYAALHQLLAPVTGRLTELPAPHGKALQIAFGLDTGTPDPFLVGVASLGLLAETVQDRPLLCVVDDAQWLDQTSAKALAFLARRISAERIALVFAAREPSRLPELDRLPALSLQGLGEADARALLAAAVRAPLDERVRDRILAEARGNPLALLELPRTAGLAGMAGGFAQPDSVPGVIEQSFRSRLELLPPQARLLVTVAAADPIGDPGLLWRAAALLGVDAAAAEQSVPLVEFGTRIRFSHPLARSAAYRAAGPEERRRAHEALAAVTDPVADPDRRAWHRAQASAAPTRRSPTSSRSPPPAPRNAAASPRRRPSSNAPPRSPSARSSAPSGSSRPPRPSFRWATSTRRPPCSPPSPPTNPARPPGPTCCAGGCRSSAAAATKAPPPISCAPPPGWRPPTPAGRGSATWTPSKWASCSAASTRWWRPQERRPRRRAIRYRARRRS